MTDPTPSAPIPQNDPDDEILTAFLDEELSDSEKAQTEKRLETEPRLRARLEKLRAAGRFLDSLETLPLNREMTADTMEILTGVVQKEIRAAEKRRRRQNLILFPLLFLGVVALFLGADLWYRRAYDREFSDEHNYPVFSHLDTLQAIGDLEFLKQLSELSDFGGSDSTGRQADGSAGDAAGEPKDERLGDFPPRPGSNDNEVLSQPGSRAGDNASVEIFLNKVRFYGLGHAERKAYRKLYHEITADPEKARLESTLVSFGDWFRHQISEADRYRFWSATKEERLAVVKEILREQKTRPLLENAHRNAASRQSPPFGSGRDSRPSRQYRFRLEDTLPEELRGESLDVGDEFRAFLKEHFKNEATEKQKPPRRRREVICGFIGEKGIDHFTEQLSDKGKEYIASQPDERKQVLIGLLIQIGLSAGEEEHFRGRRPFGRRGSPSRPNETPIGTWKTESTADLAETLRKLPEKTREELLALPADEMYSRLLLIHWGFESEAKGVRRGKTSLPSERGAPECDR
ncbi:MAG: anti-sigma factor family protein [Thermoguttaceae bacterium]